jgi:hypothetical protein
MIPVGYMAKRVQRKPDWLKAPQVIDVYSVSSCISEDFADYINYWKHNRYWFFDSPSLIRTIAEENSISIDGSSLFYYEVYEMQFDGEGWCPYMAEESIPTNIVSPSQKRLEGFDIVTFLAEHSPECSPLSCNSLAEEVHTNEHCLFASFEDAKSCVESGMFGDSEPGPYRIFAVYSVDWASRTC